MRVNTHRLTGQIKSPPPPALATGRVGECIYSLPKVLPRRQHVPLHQGVVLSPGPRHACKYPSFNRADKKPPPPALATGRVGECIYSLPKVLPRRQHVPLHQGVVLSPGPRHACKYPSFNRADKKPPRPRSPRVGECIYSLPKVLPRRQHVPLHQGVVLSPGPGMRVNTHRLTGQIKSPPRPRSPRAGRGMYFFAAKSSTAQAARFPASGVV